MIIYTVYGEEEVSTQVCIYCGLSKPASEFPKRKDRRKGIGGLDGRCFSCKKIRDNLVKNIRKTAPPMTEFCECCGKKSDRTLHLDHDPTTGKFRGWLCGDCNKSIGHLGDTVEGLMRAVRYLEKANG